MKTYRTILVVICLACSVAMLSAAIATNSRSRSMAPSGVFSVEANCRFGDVPADQKLTGHIRLQNNTGSDVLIDPIVGTCGCLVFGQAVVVRAGSDVDFTFQIQTPKVFGVFRHQIKFHVANTVYTTHISGKVQT